jgi:RimJ/RimL family protein N-acetyltransferase
MVPAGGRELLVALKASAKARGPGLSVPVGRPLEAVLRPVATRKGDLNPEDVRLLTEWRNRYVRSFLTEFRATEGRTERWLTETIGPDDTRILFMLDDANGRTVGHASWTNLDWERRSAEFDSPVRGTEVDLRLMTKALRTMMDWAEGQLGLPYFGGRVRSDNRALKWFQRKLGALEVKRVPLRRIEEPGMIRWVEDPSLPPGEPSLVYIANAAGLNKIWAPTEKRDP